MDGHSTMQKDEYYSVLNEESISEYINGIGRHTNFCIERPILQAIINMLKLKFDFIDCKK